MEKYRLFDAELKFLNLVWESEPINSTNLSKMCFERLGWKKSTTYNMIRKLSERSILKNQDAVVSTLIKREQVQKYESEAIVDKRFKGSLPAFLTAFLRKKKISEKEAKELIQIIEEATK